MKPHLVVFLHSDRYDRLYQAVSMVLTASALGRACHLNLFYQALGSYVNGTWDNVNIAPDSSGRAGSTDFAQKMQKGFELSNFPSLYEMLEKAREESGGVKVLACTTSCKILDLDTAAVREKVDEVVGLPTMLRLAEEADHVIYI